MTRATGPGWQRSLLWVLLVAGCSESAPVDMWINMNPEAGAGFEAPIREAGANPDAADADDAPSGSTGAAGGGGGDGGGGGAAGSGGSGGAGGDGGDGGGGAGGTGGDSPST